MTSSPEMWIAINTIGLVALGIISIYNNRQQTKKIVEVKEIVDGPLSVALKSNRNLSARIASITGDHGDLKIAMEAKAVQENREAGKAQPQQPV